MALLKFIVGICVIGLLGYIAYHQFATAPMSSKQIVEDGLAQVKATQKLAPEREQLLRLQLAITDYIANFGAPPDDLAVLVPDYFESIPLDPATKRPFAYLREGNSYKLGEEVTGKSLSSAVAAAKQEKTEQEADETALDEVFVNPNTMQIEDFMYDASGKRDPFLPFDFSGAS
ncbi:MAG TPA: hypothetical protein PLP17_07270, partial [Oligoflexia bacterium]|nr:hypothetical protein [Oligoflexia bacterium]